MRKIVILLLGIAAFFGGIQRLDINASESSNVEVKIVSSMNAFHIKSVSDNSEYNYLIRAEINNATNGLFNYKEARHIGKSVSNSELDVETGVRVIHSNSDDISPQFTFQYIGANHGYLVTNITMSGHGKSISDLGSVYTDGNREFVLLKINGDVLQFGNEYTTSTSEHGDYVASISTIVPLAQLTHVSGGTNISNVDVTNIARGQLYPSVKNIERTIKMDSTIINADGIYSGDVFTIEESYDILDYKYLIDHMKANPGTEIDSTFEAVIKYSVKYRFYKESLVLVDQIAETLKTTQYKTFGAMQNSSISNQAGHTVKRYYPGSDVYEFNAYGLTEALRITPDKLDDSNKPVNRSIEWVTDNTSGKKFYGFTMGYFFDKSSTSDTNRIDVNSEYFWTATSSKNYGVGVDNGTDAIPAGETFTSSAYRKYLFPDTNNDLTLNVIQSEYDKYLFIDYEDSGTDILGMYSSQQKEKIELYYLSSGFNLDTEVVNQSIQFDSITNSFAELKLIPNSFTVAFDTNGGSIVESKNVVYGDKVGSTIAPSKTGYNFIGWYKDEALTEPFSIVIDTITEDTTLYAKWAATATGGESVIIDNASNFTNIDYIIMGGAALLLIVIFGSKKKKGKWS